MLPDKMTLIRFVFGVIGVLLGTYTLYAVVLAVDHGTNPAWVVFVALLIGTLSALLVKAALDRPPERIPPAAQIATVLTAAAAGASRALYADSLWWLIVGAIVGALAGSLFLLAAAGSESSS